MLACAIAFELLQTVAGRDTQILELLGSIHNPELAKHEPVELGGKAADAFALEQSLRIAIGEARDHRE